MANQEQVKILKSGVKEWNRWRKNNPDSINLEKSILRGINLSKANLQEADLREADLRETNLQKADLWHANLVGANLIGVNLQEADLSGSIARTAIFRYANFMKSDLTGTDFRESDLRHADLTQANLKGAGLYKADLYKATLLGANLSGAVIGGTIFAAVNLGESEGLQSTNHFSSSTVGADTLQLSKGKIPIEFLRGCGLSDWEIESTKLYQLGLSSKEIDDILYRIHDLRATQAIQINPLFISYSHKDSSFINAMEKHLDSKGIRFWRDIHHATAGRLEKVVDRAMRQNPTVLLVLSENSVQSDWVEHEARSARELEKELKRDVLCPVALDDAWKNSSWPARLREQIMEYNILDFSNWKDESEFTRKFARLVEGLDLFYKE